MHRLWLALAIAFIIPTFAAAAADAPPTVDDFKRALEARLQKLKPGGMSERQVLFQEVRQGKPDGGAYPFETTLLIRDYGPGYPANKYYGETCVGRMDKWRFNTTRDSFDGWIVEGRMTVSDARQCKPNPAAGASAVPLASLQGAPAPQSAAAPAAAPPVARPAASPAAGPAATGGGGLRMGEYACYGTGGRLLAGLNFVLQPNGQYSDSDGKRGGTYAYDAGSGMIRFSGGVMDGQSGKNARNTFQLSSTVSCEPWRK